MRLGVTERCVIFLSLMKSARRWPTSGLIQLVAKACAPPVSDIQISPSEMSKLIEVVIDTRAPGRTLKRRVMSLHTRNSERWDIAMPFGLPVDPDVKQM